MSAVVQQQAPPTDLIALAIESKADVETLERLFALKERNDANEARAAFFQAMQRVQAEATPIVKDAKNAQTGSMYARLETIARALAPLYTSHGFSLSYGTADSPLDGYIRVTCQCMHVGGHSEPYHFDLPVDDIGIKGNANKTRIHGSGSTISYGRRYLVLMIFNVVMAGEDDDGQEADNTLDKLNRLLEHNKVAREWLPTILCIIENLGEGGDLSAAAEAYAEIPRPILMKLNLAWTKGGLFKTAENDFMKHNKEFHALVHQHRTDAGWYQRPENEQ